MKWVAVIEAINKQKLLIDVQVLLALEQLLLETIQVILVRKIDKFNRFFSVSSVTFGTNPLQQVLSVVDETIDFPVFPIWRAHSQSRHRDLWSARSFLRPGNCLRT